MIRIIVYEIFRGRFNILYIFILIRSMMIGGKNIPARFIII